MDPLVARQALTHRSAGAQNNERLEFLGDALVNFVVADALYRQFPQVDEGTLTRMRAALVRESALAELARELNLGEQLILGPGEMKSGGHRRESNLADAVEALAAATYMHAGMDAAVTLVRGWFTPRVQALDPKWHGKDGKTRLQEWVQGRGLDLPIYQLISAEGPEHAKTFVVSCEVAGMSLAKRASGHSRKLAETRAAESVLAELESRK